MPISELYTFYLDVDNGAKFSVNDAAVIDHYGTNMEKGQGKAKWGEEATSEEL